MKLYQAPWRPIGEQETLWREGGAWPFLLQQGVFSTGRTAAEPDLPREGQDLSPAEQVLAARGYSEAERSIFLAGETGHDPFLLPDMEAAVIRILKALKGLEMILIYGDYDADGVTATTILYRFLRERGARVGWYIPDRLEEGYGLNEKGISYIKTASVDLLITVDCGVSNRVEIADLEAGGVEVIVTDHHTCPAVLPNCRAVINPKRLDSRYSFSDLAGAGVAYKLVEALAQKLALPESQLDDYKALASVGTVGDMMPLLDENRALVQAGLEILSQGGGGFGLQALLNLSDPVRPGSDYHPAARSVRAEDIGYKIAPLINAGSRMGDSLCAPFCLLAEDLEEARQAAGQLAACNAQRRDLEQLVMAACMHLLEADPGYLDDRILLLCPPVSHPGISGIVAARLAKRFLRPVIILAADEESGTAMGSGRSFADFNLYEQVNACSDLLLQHGGHAQAVGLSVALERVADLRKQLNVSNKEETNSAVLNSVTFPQLPVKYWDLACSTFDLTPSLFKELEALAPFGRANDKPRLLLKNVNLLSARLLGKEGKHLRLTVESVERTDSAVSGKEEGGEPLTAVAFGFGSDYRWLSPGLKIDLLGCLSINRWRGREQLQFIVDDWRFAETALEFSVDSDVRNPANSGMPVRSDISRESLPSAGAGTGIPEKEALAAVYRFVLAALPDRIGLLSAAYCTRLLNEKLANPIATSDFYHIMIIYEEAGLMHLSRPSQDSSVDLLGVVIRQPDRRVDLYETPTYRRLSEKSKQ